MSARGFGPVEVGHTLAAAMRALGNPARVDTMGGASEGCSHVRLPNGPRGVRLMVVNDTVVRVEVDTTGVATEWGDRVGDMEAAVLERHAGRVRVQPHPYTGPEGHYLVVAPPGDTLRRLIFETDGRRVVEYRVGRRPEVDWIEGCS